MRNLLYSTTFRWLALLLLLFTASLAATAAIIHWRNNHYVCYSNLVIEDSPRRATMMFAYFIHGDKGTVLLKGKVEENGRTFSLSRAEDFNIVHRENWYQVKSTQLDKSPADDVPDRLLARMLPEFYSRRHAQFEFTVVPQGWHGFIYSTGVIPSFYCRRG